MMRLRQFRYWALLLITGCAINAVADDVSMTLAYNPFSKPAMLAVPAEKAAKQEEVVAQTIAPQLTATLVSAHAPLVIVGGEMLGIGDEIDGYRLLTVEEGSAVFQKNAKRHTFVLDGNGVDVE